MEEEVEFYLQQLAEKGPGAVIVNSPGVLEYKNLQALRKLNNVPLELVAEVPTFNALSCKNKTLADVVREVPSEYFVMAVRHFQLLKLFKPKYWICLVSTDINDASNRSYPRLSAQQAVAFEDRAKIIESQWRYSVGIKKFGQPGVIVKLRNGKLKFKTENQLQHLMSRKVDMPGMESYNLAQVIDNCPEDRFILVEDTSYFWFEKTSLIISVVSKDSDF